MYEEEPSYVKKMTTFYFAPVWQSFFRIFYLVIFSYFAVFHSGKILLAGKYLFYTLKNSTLLLGLDYLLWGVTFIIALIIPFSISVYALLLFYEVWEESKWSKKRKVLLSLLLFSAIPLIIILMDDIIRFVASQNELREFVVLNQINVSGK